MSDIKDLYTWTEIAADGTEGTIAGLVPMLSHLGMINLVTRDREIAEGLFGEVAKAHHRASGHRVRLVRWTAREDLRDLK
jgi:phosphoserine phosphatase